MIALKILSSLLMLLHIALSIDNLVTQSPTPIQKLTGSLMLIGYVTILYMLLEGVL